jgi:hypothetical protein
MSTSVSFNGVSYNVPASAEVNWADLSDYLIAIASGALQKSGGAFTLSAEVDFGGSFGLKAAYWKSRAPNVASTGQIRLGNTETIAWRNAANGADVSLSIDGSDEWSFNGTALSTTELGYVAGVTSGIQAQLDSKFDSTLADGSIFIGNASNVATAQTVTGDISITNAGVASIATGAIVNADVNASAAIDYSKLNLTGSIVGADLTTAFSINTTGNLTTTATVAAGTLTASRSGDDPLTVTRTETTGASLDLVSFSDGGGEIGKIFVDADNDHLGASGRWEWGGTQAVAASAAADYVYSITNSSTAAGSKGLYLQGGGSTVTDPILYWVNAAGTARGVFESGGRTGFGTTTPSAQVHSSPGPSNREGLRVTAEHVSANTATIRQDSAGVGAGNYTGNMLSLDNETALSTGFYFFRCRSDVDGTVSTPFSVRGDGQVNIGSSANPTMIVDGLSGSSPKIGFYVNGSTVTANISANSDGDLNIAAGVGDEIRLTRDGTRSMTIDGSGNVIIGTNTSATSLFELDDDVNGVTSQRIVNENTGSSAGAGVKFAALGGSVDMFKNGTNRTSEGGAETFNVINESGGAYLGVGSTSWAAISDMRYKTRLRGFKNGLSKLQGLDVFEYTLKGQKRGSRKREYLGLSAQEVVEVLPQVVEGSKETKMGLMYERFVPVLISAVQELALRLEKLEGGNT